MKHIKIKSSEVLHGGKTLDKEIKDINDKIGKIAPDGSKIATRNTLGNVIIGENINVDDKGTINIPMANGESGIPGLVVLDAYISDWDNYINVAIDDSGYLGVPIAGVSDSEFGVVKNNPPDYDWDSYINAVISDKGFIGIPRALPGGDTGVVSVVNNIQDDKWDDYIELSIDNYSQLGVPKASTDKFGVVMPDSEDFTTEQGPLQLSYIAATIPTTVGNLIINVKGKQGTIIQDWEVNDLNEIYWHVQEGFKNLLYTLTKLLVNGYNLKYMTRLRLNNTTVSYLSGIKDYSCSFAGNDYQHFEDFKDAINYGPIDCDVNIYVDTYDNDNVLHRLLVADGNLV